MSKTNQKTIQYWQQHVAAFKSSRLTRVAYSKREHIRVYQLDYWRKKLSRLGMTAESFPDNQWVPLKINDGPGEEDSSINLWAGRIRIEVRKGFDARLLADILRAVAD